MASLSAAWRDRVVFLKLLGNAGTVLVIALVAVSAVVSVIPAAAAAATGWLIASIDRDFVVPLLSLGALLLLSQVSITALRWLAVIAMGRIDGAHRSEVARIAVSTATVDVIERQEVQDLLKVASANPTEWVEKTPGQGAAAALNVTVRFLGMAASAAVVAAWSPWLVPLLVGPALLVRHLAVRLGVRHYRIWVEGIEHHRRYQYWGALTASVPEAKELRVFGLADWIIDRRQDEMRAHLTPVWADDRTMAFAQWKQLLASALPMATVFCAVAYAAATGSGSIGIVSAVLAAGWGVFSSISSADGLLQMEGARPSIEALAELRRRLTSEPKSEAESRSQRQSVPPLIRFEDVEFGYSEGSPVVKGLSLDIVPGETLAVVGFNGTGKSTLIKLLTGLYRPNAGRITADGVDITEHPDWRSGLAVVFQDFIRYHLTVAENIALGAGGAADERSVRKAANDAGFDGVLERLGSGLDSSLDRTKNGGLNLSGGQWQQLALARAMYAVSHGARVLVLDEPTAHLDVRTEKELFDRLEGLTYGLTTILVSHRLSTVRRADRIVLLADGRVAESGTHAELMAAHGAYAHMYNLQADRYRAGFDDRLEEGELR